ncbi:SusC/RagA family TonB-linked outer membrane protein [Flavivirga spongiicola]|uniref:SusC/RagA family TonB-linked outer membrane protein n=1 Tax=Flavivirga spongiicola TaxID=421621 RepID=A0ABU7XTS8_9FLAO|nr:SusC/RagA family TonB-linked outer membrane protein [Flavivirga sp. MEBiC05379]MDO5979179.1 SusC/RagA family TonB-linked outer membrane protein [Flavivirga sp. MEBiC05379]
MRVFLFLFCTTVFSFTPSNAVSQNSRIKIKEDITLTVDEVFNLIRQQTDYKFIYEKNIFKEFRPIMVKKGIIRTNKLLQKSLSQGDFNLVVTTNNTILIREKLKRRQKQVSGEVSNREGLPLAGVVVLIKGTSTGTVTNFDGKYNINVPNPENVLVFSFLGYATQEILVSNQSTIDVTLKEDVDELSEVIVTGYQTISPNKSTGSTAVVSGKTLERKGNSNLLQSLEGQIPGLLLSNDPTQEGRTNINIRGIANLNGNATPLIVVDGFPLEADLSSINPYEVETVTVLKDAAAASIYGARSANGVIVITTKRGKSGKMKVGYRSFLTITQGSDLAYRLNRADADTYIDTQLQTANNFVASGSFSGHTYQWYLDNLPNFANFFSGSRNIVADAVFGAGDGYITETERDARINAVRGIDNLKQIEDTFYQSQFQQQHNLSLSGGNDKSTFRTSINYTSSEGQNVGSETDRFLIDLVNNIKINDKVNIDLVGNVTFNNSESIPIDEGTFTTVSPYERIYDESGNPLAVRTENISFGTNNQGLSGGKDPLIIQNQIDAGLLDENYYPLQELKENKIETKDVSLRIQARVNAQLASYLNGSFSFQYESGSTRNDNLQGAEAWALKNLINNATPLSFDGDLTELNIPRGARLIETRSNRNSYTLRGQLDFNKTFGDHEISALAGTEIRHIFRKSTVTDRFGFDENTLQFRFVNKGFIQNGNLEDVWHPNGIIAGGIPFNDNFNETTDRFFSLFGNASYGYKNKYILSGSVRIDQSNLFGTNPEFRYKPFWSAGFKWRALEEDFINIDWLDQLDVRASYGINGNISNQFGPFDIAQFLFTPFINDEQSLRIITPGINDLRWERTATTNIGLDLAFLNNRVNLGLDYYNRKTTDLLANSEADTTLGFASLVRNDANIDNNGIEVSLSTVNMRTKNFSWSTNITFRHNKNEVKEVFTEEQSPARSAGRQNLTGAPANTFWVWDYAGLNEEGFPTIKKANGDIITIDNDINTGELFDAFDFEDRVDAGTTDPIYTGAITNTFNYKDLSLSFLFVGSGGHVLSRDSYNGTPFFIGAEFIHSDVTKAWRKPGDENTTNIPRLDGNVYAPGFIRNSNKNIVDGDYIRLREVILTYNLSGKWIKNTFDNVTLNFRANNLFDITKNDFDIDPEAHGLGRRFFKVEPSYTFGINLNF